ncbi:hypothetical protein ACJIZ3_023505 [Penstemon smallii]|uniref:Myb/SANT-like domain-containing protein n=1 Tax=Penstemon smallii TaxID=265156 RepID=A0ABD3TP88_9LAMI
MSSRLTRSKKQVQQQQLDMLPESQSRAKWTSTLTKTLVDSMVEQIEKGNKSNKSFSKKGWKFICDNFRIQTGLWWDNDQLKSRYSALRKQYISLTSLLDHREFKWDETTCTIIATDEAWDKYIKEHPDAEAVRNTGCPIYNQLRIIFAETATYEEHNGSIKDSSIPSRQNISMSPEEQSQSESEKNTDMASRKRGRRGIEDAIAKGILEIAAARKLRAEAIKKHNERFSVTDCVSALDELQGVSDQVYFAALDLFSNRSSRETFLSLKVEKRLIWLQGKCSSTTFTQT